MSKDEIAKYIVDLKPYEYFPFASFVRGRTNGTGSQHGGEFKRHKTLAHAKSATSSSHGYVRDGEKETHLYKWVGDFENGYWVMLDE